MDAQQRQYYELVYPSILNKLEAGMTVTFTEQEARVVQTLYQHFRNLCLPFPVLQAREMTFGQDLRQYYLVKSILTKVEAAF